MRLNDYVLDELSSGWGKGITFIDIDETIFQTKAMIYVMHNGQIVNKLSNQDFNTYKLKDGESFDFREFKDAKLFSKTSIPIPKVIERIKRMFKNIDIRGSKVVLLTARADFDDRDVFLATFSNIGIPINNIYVERTGNMTTGTVAARKKATIMKYLSTGEYRRVRLIDDDTHNLMIFLSLKDELPQQLIDKVKSKYNIKDGETLAPIEFYALQVVDSSGTLKLIRSQVSETTCVGTVGYYPNEVLGAVGSFGGPDNLIGGDPEWMHPPEKEKQSLKDFLVISNQKDWDDLFSSFWSKGENVEQVSNDPGLDAWGNRFVAEDVVPSSSPVGTTTGDIAVPDTLIGGKPGEMTRRFKKKKKKRKSLEDVIKGKDNE